MTATYTESWKASSALLKHMWRFYITHQDAEPEDMTQAVRLSWEACNHVWNGRSASDRAIISAYHSVPHGTDYAAEIRKIAETYSMSVELIIAIINDTYLKTAIERGIADR